MIKSLSNFRSPGVAAKLVYLLVLASLVPLLLFGGLSLWQARKTTIISVTEGNINVSRRAAREIEQYILNALNILESLAENINTSGLESWQKEKILNNYLNRFGEFNDLSILNARGEGIPSVPIKNDGPGGPRRETFEKAFRGEPALSRVFIKEDLTPAMVAGFPIHGLSRIDGVLLGELNLLEMWRLVDEIRIGKKGILHVVGTEGKLIATGSGERKKDIFLQNPFTEGIPLPQILESRGAVFKNSAGEEVLTVGTRLKEPLNWTLLVEQPTHEAYALATRMSRLLILMLFLFLFLALGVGYFGGKREVLDPVRNLLKATEELAGGNLDYRIRLKGSSEFSGLGEAFNQMANRLKELQKKLILEERHALFGRIASGLIHDLKHPIQAVETSSRLMHRLHEDPEYREIFSKTIQREFAKINCFLDNLHKLTGEIPHQPIPISLADFLKETLATFEPEAAKKGVQIKTDFPKTPVPIHGDIHSLNRAVANLIANALQAIENQGTLLLACRKNSDSVQIEIKDSGIGIEPERIQTLFEDFATTRSNGLGLGLAIARKIITRHQGKIELQSRVGEGTCVTVTLPAL